MRLLIRGQDEEPIEKTLYFWLESGQDGIVDVHVEDEDGSNWFLIGFKPDGTTIAYDGLPARLGFKLGGVSKNILKITHV